MTKFEVCARTEKFEEVRQKRAANFDKLEKQREQERIDAEKQAEEFQVEQEKLNELYLKEKYCESEKTDYGISPYEEEYDSYESYKEDESCLDFNKKFN